MPTVLVFVTGTYGGDFKRYTSPGRHQLAMPGENIEHARANRPQPGNANPQFFRHESHP